jgi:2,4-dienoyl-CoA reductase-like NADH-dependent reductase (Old Yellow Enzyme family)
VHAEGGLIFPQLWHLGAQRKPGSPPFPDAPVISPSGVDAAGEAIGSPASQQDLAEIAASFGRAAADARAAGFDGVELHGAHGYLLDQFHWSVSNRRTDRYGGDMAGRVRFSAEVVAAVRAAVGADYPVAFRFSQWKGGHYDAQIAQTADELAAFLTPLADAGVSMFHVSTRRYWQPAFEGSDRTLAGWTRQLSGVPVIAIGSIGVATQFLAGPDEDAEPTLTLAPLVELFRRGEFDLVALGRAVLADPEWASKLTDARLTEIRPYDKSAGSVLF